MRKEFEPGDIVSIKDKNNLWEIIEVDCTHKVLHVLGLVYGTVFVDFYFNEVADHWSKN